MTEAHIEYTSSGVAMLVPGQTIFMDGKRYLVRSVIGGRLTLDRDTRNHQQRRVDRAKARAALTTGEDTTPNAGKMG